MNGFLKRNNQWRALCMMCILTPTLLDAYRPPTAIPNSDKEFIEKFIVPKSVSKALDDHVEFLTKVAQECSEGSCRRIYKHLVWKFESLPNYYVKWGIDRIVGREILCESIKRLNLTLLTIPRKYLYHIPGKKDDLTDENYLVLSEAIEPIQATIPIDLDEVKQICALILDTGYLDLHGQNIIRTQDKKLAIVDSETNWIRNTGQECYGLERILFLEKFNLNTDFTREALRYLLVTIQKCRPLGSGQYNRLLKVIEKQPRPLSWDYLTFFKELYPEYSHGN